MNPTMTLLYLEANRAEPSSARAAGTKSRRTQRVRRTRRWF